MSRFDSGTLRFAAWLGLASASCLLLYSGQVVTFFLLLDGKLNDTFGTAFPAIPFAALLAVLFLLRWGDLHALLLKEGGVRTRPWTRALGLFLAVFPLALAPYSAGSLELSAASLILVFYGTSLLISPGTARLLLPFAALYVAGVTAPAAIQYFWGEPLAGLASSLSAGIVNLAGIPVAWHGTEFTLMSRAGAPVTGTITPGCSSVLSVTTFLGLLGLMHFDFRKDARSTLEVAVVGSGALVLLNSLRIGALIWAGYTGGPDALWGLHNWVGYAIFLGFYLVVMAVYSGMGRPGGKLPGDFAEEKGGEGLGYRPGTKP